MERNDVDSFDIGFQWTPDDVTLALHTMVPGIDRTKCGTEVLTALRERPDETISQLVGKFGGNLRSMLAVYEGKVDKEIAIDRLRRAQPAVALVPPAVACLAYALDTRSKYHRPAKPGEDREDDKGDGDDDRIIPLDPDAHAGESLLDNPLEVADVEEER